MGNSGRWQFSILADAQRWAESWQNHDLGVVKPYLEKMGDAALSAAYLSAKNVVNEQWAIIQITSLPGAFDILRGMFGFLGSNAENGVSDLDLLGLLFGYLDALSVYSLIFGQVGSGVAKAPAPVKYKTRDEAAFAALAKYNPLSIRDNKEYGGLIYKNADGTYGFTPPVIGDYNGVKLRDIKLPQGAVGVADYHTHGDYSDSDGNRTTKDLDRHDSDNFSTPDREGNTTLWKIDRDYAKTLGTPQMDWNVGYLGTPSGVFKKYNPGALPPYDVMILTPPK